MTSILKTFKLIKEFENLPQGWNFGEGEAASAISSTNSQELLRFAFDLGHRESEVFPGNGGEIQVCFYNEDDDTLELTCEKNGTITISVEKQDENVFYKANVSIRDAIKILKDFTYNKCLSYVSLTSKPTTVTEKSGYLVWLSDRQQQITASQWSIKIVPRMQAQIYVSILEDIIPTLPDSQSFFGRFPQNESPLPAKLAEV